MGGGKAGPKEMPESRVPRVAMRPTGRWQLAPGVTWEGRNRPQRNTPQSCLPRFCPLIRSRTRRM